MRRRPPSRRRGSPCSRSRPPEVRRGSTRRSVATSRSSRRTARSTSSSTSIPRCGSPRRADRGLQDRPGGARQRAAPCRRRPCRGLDLAAGRAPGRRPCPTTASASTRPRSAKARVSRTCARGREAIDGDADAALEPGPRNGDRGRAPARRSARSGRRTGCATPIIESRVTIAASSVSSRCSVPGGRCGITT